MSDQLNIECGPPDGQRRRLVLATWNGRSHRDRFDTDSDYHRRKFRESVVDKFGLPEDAHDVIERKVIAAADAEDERSAGNGSGLWLPKLVTMADVESRPIQWLWPERIALGRISLLVGMPGAGKSFLTCDMAARVSTGQPWPDGSRCERGSVLLVTAEDDPGDTIRPRLDAQGADVARVHQLAGLQRQEIDGSNAETIFSLGDAGALESALRKLEDCRLIVVDPIGSFLGARTDAHRDNEVRAVLAPVAKLAEQYGPAVLVVAHRRKGGSAVADDTAMGSRAFTGIARSVWHLSHDPENRGRRLLLPGKSNLTAEQSGLAFAIAGDPGAVQWERDPVKMTADDAMAQEQGVRGEGSALDEAMSWLRDALASGSRSAKELRSATALRGGPWSGPRASWGSSTVPRDSAAPGSGNCRTPPVSAKSQQSPPNIKPWRTLARLWRTLENCFRATMIRSPVSRHGSTILSSNAVQSIAILRATLRRETMSNSPVALSLAADNIKAIENGFSLQARRQGKPRRLLVRQLVRSHREAPQQVRSHHRQGDCRADRGEV
ncbi:MAG: AAA family ATPase [Planctomycetaceae bacterium]|nr:AAA family ATPase [Planctomycetaceae bacterium]